MATGSKTLGVVLAGGAATRLGGGKATLDLAGRPLISYPLAAFAAAGIEVLVVAKADTPLPALDVELLREPDEPRHPLAGVVAALERAAPQAVVVCPCDTPFVTPALLRELAAADCAACVHDGLRLHPLLARFDAAAAPSLRYALDGGDSATAAIDALAPRHVPATPATTFNVNSPADLREAERRVALGL